MVWGKDGRDQSNGAETDRAHQVQGLWFGRAQVSSPTWPPVKEPSASIHIPVPSFVKHPGDVVKSKGDEAHSAVSLHVIHKLLWICVSIWGGGERSRERGLSEAAEEKGADLEVTWSCSDSSPSLSSLCSPRLP